MTTVTPPLLDRSILPLAELFALVLDGQLFRVGDAFAPLDVPETADLRARAFAAVSPGPAIADRGTAAWIHGARASPPPRPQVCVDPLRRGRLPDGVDAHQHEVAPYDTVRLGGVRVTAPLRTAMDLLLTAPRFGWPEAVEVRHLLNLAGAGIPVLVEGLEGSKRNGVRRALRRMGLVRRAPEPAVPAGTAVPVSSPATRGLS